MNRNMVKKFVVSLLVGVLIYFFAVSFNDSSDPASYFSTNQEPSKEAPLSKEAAMEIAQKEIAYRVNFARDREWTSETKVVDAFPIFMDGIEGLSYYECKIMTNGQDAGYILINVNGTDLLISESAQQGITLTERYREKLGRNDIIVLRYDWFRSIAVQKQAIFSNSREQILASIGFEEKRTDKNAIDKYRSFVLSKGCFPMYSKEELHKYYEELQSNEYSVGWGNNVWAADYRNITAELRHKDWVTRTGKRYYTPRWRQFEKSNGHAIGCGNTAWAIVYGYWDKSKGKSRLFNDNWSDIRDCMSACAGYTDTRDVYERSKKWGYTAPGKFSRGINYAKNKGYRSSSCTRVQKTNEYEKFDAIYPHLNADKPCVLLLDATGFGFPNHYAVIEKATKRQRRRTSRSSWRDRDVYFTVNIGDAGDSKEIWTREYGRNDHKHYSSFDVYLVDVR